MEKIDITKIDPKIINSQNYAEKFNGVYEVLDEMRKELDIKISMAIYRVLAKPNIDTVDGLVALVNYKSLLNNEVTEVLSSAYRSGRLEWDEKLQKKLNELFQRKIETV